MFEWKYFDYEIQTYHFLIAPDDNDDDDDDDAGNKPYH